VARRIFAKCPQRRLANSVGRACAGCRRREIFFAIVPTKQPLHGDVVACVGAIKSQLAAGGTVYLSAASTGELERLADISREYEVPYVLGESETPPRDSPRKALSSPLVSSSFARRFLMASRFLKRRSRSMATPICRRHTKRRTPSKKIRTSGFFSDFADLKPGDFVVHVDHGIGQFEGLRQIESDGRRGEFMLLRYAEDARLYVPLERMDLVQSYRVVEGAEPPLDKLGGTGWTTRKARVRKSLEDMADKLLELYASRKSAKGFSFTPDGHWQREFEDAFEFEETTDQNAAIADIKRDMERETPMDRLLCGDVGDGKTEVAMRAAFKAVADGKKVAVLAPTTVLAFQHFESFKRRFAAFPAKIEMLSRFRSAAEQKKILAELEAGKVDVVIGTHRLLSKDIVFVRPRSFDRGRRATLWRRAQRTLEGMRRNVDALALSATPIPRTLHMSLVGLRDMSLIETPPRDRLAIQPRSRPSTRNSFERPSKTELQARWANLFHSHRVESIYSLAELVGKLVPKARIVVGHGQMAEKELESVMLKFIRDEGDVLVATTIVENGLDIRAPNTNTSSSRRSFGAGRALSTPRPASVVRTNARTRILSFRPEATLSESRANAFPR